MSATISRLHFLLKTFHAV